MSLWLVRYAGRKIGLTLASGTRVGELKEIKTVELPEEEIGDIDLPVGALREVKIVELDEASAK